MKKVLFLLILFSCSSQKKIPNYKVTEQGYIIWRYTRPGQPQKDILSSGDTLVTTKDSIYIIYQKCRHEIYSCTAMACDQPCNTCTCLKCGYKWIHPTYY